VALRCPNRSCPAQIKKDSVILPPERHGHPRARGKTCGPTRGAGTSAKSRGPLRSPRGGSCWSGAPRGDLVRKLVAAIDASRRRPFARLLAALGIRHVGAGSRSCSPSDFEVWRRF
jgi:NAD-dependent DNA ligase